MYRTLLADASFHELLLAFDRDLAARARAEGCARCLGALHAAAFKRKPRGVPAGLSEEHTRRFSFCCAQRECRKRETPPSVRFLGRKIYAGVMVVVVSAMRQGGKAARQLAAPARPGTLRLMPDEARIKDLRARDYRAMASMMFDDSPPPFDDVLAKIVAIQETINA